MLDPKKDIEKIRETWNKIEKKAPIISFVISSGAIITKWIIVSVGLLFSVLILMGLWQWLYGKDNDKNSSRTQNQQFIPVSGRIIKPADKPLIREW